MATPKDHSSESDEELRGFADEDLNATLSTAKVKGASLPQHRSKQQDRRMVRGESNDDPKTGASDKANAVLLMKMAERDDIIRCLNRQKLFLENYAESDALYVPTRLKRVRSCWEQFQDVTRVIRSIEGVVTASEELVDEIDEQCMLLIGQFEDKMKVKTNDSAMAGRAMDDSKVRLPPLALPEFAGNFDEWLPFHSLYVSAVHENNSLSDTEKIMYLKRALKDEAFRVVDAFPTCGAAYEAAWKALEKRYANEYLLKKRYINELLNMPKIKTRKTKDIHTVVDNFERNTKLLEQLGETTSGYGMLLTQLILSKLDDETQRNWERQLEKDSKCSVASLFDFLRAETRVLDAMAVDQHGLGVTRRADRRVVNLARREETTRVCVQCSKQHHITACTSFAEMTSDDKMKVAMQKKLCLNCLSPGHFASKCFSKNRCSTCRRRHHSLLHKEDISEAGLVQQVSSDVEGQVCAGTSSMLAVLPALRPATHGLVMLSTAMVRVEGKGGKWFSARALLDNGSQINIMTADLCRRLRLPKMPGSVTVTGIGKIGVPNTQVTKALVSSKEKTFLENIDFVVLDHITENQPCDDLRFDVKKIPNNMVLADPEFYKKGPIDLLLGAEYFVDILQRDCKVVPATSDHPGFVKTVFGWVASGRTSYPKKQQAVCHLVTAEQSYEKLTECLERFWTIEELPDKPQSTQQEQDCEESFSQFHHRDAQGRYIVDLPFKIGECEPLGESKQSARKRFLQLERRMIRDPSLGREYAAVISDYINQGFLKKVAVDETGDNIQQSFYLPHHPVIKESSTSTKVRPVFDGSAKTSNGISLNQVLLKGPVIQDSLFDLLLRFRMRAVALVADIKQMYLQVKVDPKHTRYQRILWREDPTLPIEEYELQRVTFGLTPSSFLATRVLKQLAADEGDAYPRAQKALLEDFYVDDFLGGADNEEEARQLVDDLIKLMEKGGFLLQKWNSNSSHALEQVAFKDLPRAAIVSLSSDEHVKTLGITWHPQADELSVETKFLASDEPWTRRRVYSMVAKLFDPVGLLAPVTAWAKIHMQALWIATQEWDEPIPTQMECLWNKFQAQLSMLKEIKFTRHAVIDQPLRIQFHCFSDASEAAYGACVYIRSTDVDGNVKVELLSAKSRPAPLKRISLARLELCGAVLATKLMKCVGRALKMENMETFMWTDSTIVLHWLRSPSYEWNTFVANRVSMVQEVGKGYRWLHVKGSDNPADIVSRGALPKEMITSVLWFHGPSWLGLSDEKWKLTKLLDPPDEGNLERKRKVLVAVSKERTEEWAERFSQFWRCLKVTAYCVRFIKLCRRSGEVYTSKCLTRVEIVSAKMTLVKMLQRDHFAAEVKELSNGRVIPPSSKLKKLGAFLDEDGLLRVGGRLSQLTIPYAEKHPLVLPGRACLTKLLARVYHLRAMHSGPRATLAAMRREFWPINGRRVVNDVCRSCVTCFKAEPTTVIQPSGQIPESRATSARPFSIVGLDYCGPFYLRPVHRRAAAQKCYMAVFVCFTVKAIHLELVEDLSTAAFMAAFRRFVSRRGLPSKVYSDNGLNFRGASGELKELYELLKDPENQQFIQNAALRDDIEWHFIPPRAPNFGGLWEAAVKSAKRILRKVMGNQRLSFSEMTTVLSQIEAQLNSRPLTPLSEDPSELNVLTPGHFLIGVPLTALPDVDVSNQPENRLQRYEKLQRLVQLHWKRWQREYISELHNYGQRVSPVKNVVEGQIVLLKEDNVPVCVWPMGRVEAIFLGPDQVARVVRVRTEKGSYTRPTSKICVLPIEGVNLS